MALSHGMDVEEVEKIGSKLQSHYALEMVRISDELEQMVGSTSSTWLGSDADTYRSWWPAKRRALRAIADDLHGFGQSALNNANEQRGASGADGVPGSGASVGVVPTPAQNAPSAPGASPGALPGTNRSDAEVMAAYQANYAKYGLFADGRPGAVNDYECVAWAWFRMRELGFDGGQSSGNGWQVAAHLGGTTTTVPQAGAVLSYGDGQHGSFGHVMIAEEVTTNPAGQLQVRVSEMNIHGDSNNSLDDYSSTRVWTQQANGTWSAPNRAGAGVDTKVMTIANPTYGNRRI